MLTSSSGVIIFTVLAAILLIGLVVIAVFQPWLKKYNGFQHAVIIANGAECASIGRLNMLIIIIGVLAESIVGVPVGDAPGYQQAVVVANGVECASIGRNILQKGGSAVDAAIAVLVCDGLGCAQCMGIGGGFIATIYDASAREVRVLNARERAPAAAYPNMFDGKSSTEGGLTVAVPGELKGYGALHRKYGRKKWKNLFQPSIKLCQEGHIVTENMGSRLQLYKSKILAEPSLREVYVNPETGQVWKQGDKIKLPVLAKTLDIISTEGSGALYNGSLTDDFVRDVRNFGGIITKEDLQNYKVEWRTPIKIPLSTEHTLYTTPLPGSGSILAFMLNMVNGWIGNGTNVPSGSDLYWHRIMETFKYAYAKRTGLGDPSHTNILYNIKELESNLTNSTWATNFRKLVDDTRTFSDWKHYGPVFETEDDYGTAHAIVIAPDGDIVSVTTSINYVWGSFRRSRSLGLILNNQMSDFSIPRSANSDMPPSPANLIMPGLQPISSMVPSIVLSRKGSADFVVGTAGGMKITTQTALTVIYKMFEGQNLRDVIYRPRIHHQLLPMEVLYEKDFDYKVLEALRARGHVTTLLDVNEILAVVIGVARGENGYFDPVVDPRRVGSIDGY